MPDPEDSLRATLAALDDRQKKIVGGVIAIMIEHPDRVRDREWITEQFTQITLLACGFEDVSSVREGMDQIPAYARIHIDPLLNACTRKSFTREDAVACALSYFN